ncbi:MAG TPA: FG-GAP-like repeat-containing protein, partial [Pyrinomonadaceae bacterium]|jgi:hypothetical protein
LRNQTVCNFSLSASEFRIDNGGGTGSVNVFAPTNCDYPVKSNASWIIVNSANAGSGNGTINFTVQPFNVVDAQRTGTITIGDQTFFVIQGTPFVVRNRVLDFDGDARTDYVAIQNSNGSMIWHANQSASGYITQNFGLFADDLAVPNDYDGDGRTDFAVWRNSNGTFYVLQSGNNTFRGLQFGATGDNPNVSQDFDGDARADFAVTRKENGKLVWYILNSTTGFRAVQFGNENDRPLRGDYDADGRADLAVYRPAADAPANTFIVLRSFNNSLMTLTFGNSATDKIVPGDYDGDNRTDFAVWRTTDGTWYLIKSSTGAFSGFQFGTGGDLPAPGDYDGDGRTDFAVWRPNQNPNESAIFYVQRSTAGFSAFGWGNAGMKIPANSMQSQ